MINSVRFWPRLYTEQMDFTNDFIIISITDPKQNLAKLKLNEENILRVQFLDITEDLLEPRWANSLFTSQQAEEIAYFISQKHNEKKNYQLIVHCEAGVSRSAAIALTAHTITQCDFPNKEKAVIPNPFVLSLMENQIGIAIEVPPMKISSGGIIIF